MTDDDGFKKRTRQNIIPLYRVASLYDVNIKGNFNEVSFKRLQTTVSNTSRK